FSCCTVPASLIFAATVPRSTMPTRFPYTTLFRSLSITQQQPLLARLRHGRRGNLRNKAFSHKVGLSQTITHQFHLTFHTRASHLPDLTRGLRHFYLAEGHGQGVIGAGFQRRSNSQTAGLFQIAQGLYLGDHELPL